MERFTIEEFFSRGTPNVSIDDVLTDLAKKMYYKFKDDQKSIIKLESHKVNITRFVSKTLNSDRYLVVPLTEFIRLLVDGVQGSFFKKIAFIFEVKKNEEYQDKEVSDDGIIEFLISNEHQDIWLNFLKRIWIKLSIVAAEDDKLAFLSIDNALELNAHLKNGGLPIYIHLINYIDNIHICETETIDALRPLISNKEIINWNIIDSKILNEESRIDQHFINSLINNLRVGKFLDILAIFKKYRYEILTAIMSKKSGIGSENFASEFAMWWKIKLKNPQELYTLNDKLVENQIKYSIIETKRDHSKGTLNILNHGGLEDIKLDINTTKKKIKDIEKIVENIDMVDLDTYPSWIEKIPGPESFITFLKEKYQLNIDISLFGFETSDTSIEDIQETKINLKEKLKVIDKYISDNIIGQDQNIRPLTSVMKRWFVGIRSSNKPVGSFLFVGPTGVGKTETAKILAKELFNNSLIVLDMSEYQSAVDVSKIIGIAPGYVGYEAGGGLLEKVLEKPKSVILLDEIEKAHPKVFDLFLQLLDEGRLTDNKGEVVSFKECLIIATSNACNDLIEEFQDTMNNSKEASRKDIIEILYKTGSFRKEFLARFTDILKFKSLDVITLEKIFNQKLELELLHFKNLKDFSRNIVINLTDENMVKIRNHIIWNIDKSLGAREIQRVIQERISNKILDTIVDLELNDDVNGVSLKDIVGGEDGNDLIFDLAYNGTEITVLPEVIKDDKQTPVTDEIVIEFVKKFMELFSHTNNFDSIDYSKTEIKYIREEKDYKPGNDMDIRKVIFTKRSDVEMSSEAFENLFDGFRTNEYILNEATGADDSDYNIPTITMETLSSRKYMLGDGDDSGAVVLLDDGRVEVWFRWWKED